VGYLALWPITVKVSAIMVISAIWLCEVLRLSKLVVNSKKIEIQRR
jgi:hypothetical protein